MKRGFTLIELLITVTVMATLMTIMFKLGTSSSDESKRIKTITRLQKLENCLSGYYSAFGSYPPVKIYGSRDIYKEVKNGVQTENQNGALKWTQIEAACRSQPFEACFPFADDDSTRARIQSQSDWIKKLSQYWKNNSKSEMFSSGFGMPNPGEFSSHWDDDDWETVQIFKFGVMSYLLPRYLVMMKGDKRFYGANDNKPCAQWDVNNDECISATDGEPMTWKEVYKAAERDEENDVNGNGGIKNMQEYIEVANMPSQAVCARWMGNLEGICATGDTKADAKIFGVCIKDEDFDIFKCDTDSAPDQLNIYSPGNGGSWYILDSITVRDGWDKDFYYYSPSGAQTYQLWSSGANCRTFPPWVDKTGLMDQRPDDSEKDSSLTIGEWLEDDIGGMKH